MHNDSLFDMQRITWTDCREQVTAVNPNLAKIIDELSPDDKLPLWNAKYPYGALIDDGHTYYYPIEGKLSPLNNNKIPKIIKNDFCYTNDRTPIGLLLNNSIEQFIDNDGRIIPRILFLPGDIFALWGRLDSQNIYHPSPLMQGSAGARSIFLLPNIGDITAHRKLRNDFNVRQPPPKNLTDQWEIFKSVTKYINEENPWSTEALLFPGIWLEKIKGDSSFSKLYVFLLKQAWQKTAYWRNKVYYDYVFSCIQQKRNLKPNPYLADTAKCLMTIALGALPGFAPAIDNVAAPIDLIQKAYVECYGLKKYAPTIMQPSYFSFEASARPIYYSLQHPTTLEFSPRSKQTPNTLEDLDELKHILQVFLKEVSSKKMKIEEGVMGQIAEKVSFDFFHTKSDKRGEIISTKELSGADDTLTHSLIKKSSNRFAENGSFARGCVRISHKIEDEVSS